MMTTKFTETVTEQDEDGITICETRIKMEPNDIEDPVEVYNPGEFLTVLVPETHYDIPTKVSQCKKCPNIVEFPKSLCKNCDLGKTAKRQSSLVSAKPAQSKQSFLNAINNFQNTLPFRCHYCSKIYETKEIFFDHIRVHAAKKKNPYLCGMCGKNFKELIQFKKHICARNVLKCNKCSKQFESIFRLENHYLIHSKYKCDECGKCLSSRTVLEEHKRVHANEYPFKCEPCGRKFRQKSKYNGHIYQCRKCSPEASSMP